MRDAELPEHPGFKSEARGRERRDRLSYTALNCLLPSCERYLCLRPLRYQRDLAVGKLVKSSDDQDVSGLHAFGNDRRARFKPRYAGSHIRFDGSVHRAALSYDAGNAGAMRCSSDERCGGNGVFVLIAS